MFKGDFGRVASTRLWCVHNFSIPKIGSLVASMQSVQNKNCFGPRLHSSSFGCLFFISIERNSTSNILIFDHSSTTKKQYFQILSITISNWISKLNYSINLRTNCFVVIINFYAFYFINYSYSLLIYIGIFDRNFRSNSKINPLTMTNYGRYCWGYARPLHR